MNNTDAKKNTKSKKSRFPIILVLIIVIAGGFLAFMLSPSVRAGGLVKQALAQASEKNYTKAIETMVSARELAPDNPKVIEAFYTILDKNANEFILSGSPDFTKALDVYRSAEPLLGDYKDKILKRESEVYSTWSDHVAESGSIDDVNNQISLLEEASDRGIPDLDVAISELKKQLTALETDAALKEFASRFIVGVNEQNTDLCIQVFSETVGDPDSEFFKKTLEKRGIRASNFPVLTETDGKKLGIYYKNGEYFVYCGDYDESGKRSGKGLWLTTKGNPVQGSYKVYLYSGDWENDKPNGSVYCFVYTRSVGGNEERKTAEAIVKDGLFNGSFLVSYDTIGDFEVSYIDGDPVQIDTMLGSDGIPVKVYGYSTDGGTRMLLNLSMHDGVFGTY